MDMEYTMDFWQELEGLGITGFDIGSNLFSSLLGLMGYVLLAIGMYTIAKRRGINHPWLAWLPFGSTWIMGCISDQYQYVAKGQEKSKRKWMLLLEILTYVLLIASIVVMVVSLIKVFAGMDGNPDMMLDDDAYLMEILMPLLSSLGVMLLALIPAIVLSVLQYIALYDLFSSCEPDNKVLYLVLSIFISVVMPVFVFICRKKDLGMPSRADEVVAEPAWQPPQPPVEPWDNVTEE